MARNVTANSILGLSEEDFPVTVQTYLYKEKMLCTGSNPYKPYHLILQACFKSEKLKCLQLDSKDPFYVPVSYPYPISYVPVASDRIYRTVSHLLENRKSISWFVNTQPFEIGNESFRAGTIFQYSFRRFSIRRTTNKMQVCRYPQMVSIELPCGVTGIFMSCGSPKAPAKKLLHEVVAGNIQYPFLFSLAPTLGSMSILAVSKREFHTVISCKENFKGRKKIYIFPENITRKVLFLKNKDNDNSVNRFVSEELDNIRDYINTSFHVSENFFITFVYEHQPVDNMVGEENSLSNNIKHYLGDRKSFLGRETFSGEEETHLRNCLSTIMDTAGYVNINKIQTIDRTTSVDSNGYIFVGLGTNLSIKQAEDEDTDDEFDRQQGEIERERNNTFICNEPEENGNESDDDTDCYENSNRITINEITSGDVFQPRREVTTKRRIATSSTTTPVDIQQDLQLRQAECPYYSI